MELQSGILLINVMLRLENWMDSNIWTGSFLNRSIKGLKKFVRVSIEKTWNRHALVRDSQEINWSSSEKSQHILTKPDKSRLPSCHEDDGDLFTFALRKKFQKIEATIGHLVSAMQYKKV